MNAAADTGQWEDSSLHMAQQLFYAGAYGLNQKVLTGKSFAMTNYFWDDRIVATFGWRKDDYKARQTNVAGLATSDLYFRMINPDPSEEGVRTCTTASPSTATHSRTERSLPAAAPR